MGRDGHGRPRSSLSANDKKRSVTTMSMLFNRQAIIPVWLVVFGLFALFESPMTFAMGVILILVAGVSLTIMLVWKKLHPTLAAMTAPDAALATLPSTDFVPNSWPNSGFRNSRRRGTRGA
jgi:hypothetical protein